MRSKDTYSKFEKVRIISARALQISQGSPVLVEMPKSVFDPTEIANLEWDAEVVPIDIKGKK
ncbi:MAG: DNA-directed RNA polymerase subunit K [Candidatus Aenigmarchaeota archaeon]|nr:DNA-directed RNA polymerase subunit K [Candidatus Aenigmarchaeota archaeon]